MKDEPTSDNLHAGHRARLRGRFRAEGLDSFEDHQVLEHGTIGETVHSDEVEFNDDSVPTIKNLLSSLTNRVMHKARITTGLPSLFPKVREYVREQCFGHKVELEELAVRRALNNGALLKAIARVFARHIGELTTEQRSVEVAGEPYRLSDTPEFHFASLVDRGRQDHLQRCCLLQQLRGSLDQFLDRADDVDRFAELAEWFTGFDVQYLKSSGAVGIYYPDLS